MANLLSTGQKLRPKRNQNKKPIRLIKQIVYQIYHNPLTNLRISTYQLLAWDQSSAMKTLLACDVIPQVWNAYLLLELYTHWINWMLKKYSRKVNQPRAHCFSIANRKTIKTCPLSGLY